MSVIQYLVKNESGFSVDDIKKEHFLNRTLYGIKGHPSLELLVKYDKRFYNFYEFSLYNKKGDIIHLGEAKTLEEVRDKIREVLKPYLYSQKETTITAISPLQLTLPLEDNKLQNFLDSITLDFSDKDVRGNYRGIYKGKTLFRAMTEKEYKEKIQELKDYFQDGTICFETHTDIPYKITDFYTIALYNTLRNTKDPIYADSKCLESTIGFAKYVSSYYPLDFSYEELLERLTPLQKRKVQLLNILVNHKSTILFTQDSYIKELVDVYSFLQDTTIYSTNPLDLTFKNDKLIVEDGTHRILGLLKKLTEYNKGGFFRKNDIEKSIIEIFHNIIIREGKALSGFYKEEELVVLPLKEIDELPKHPKIQEYFSQRKF